jgi:hypothetical protein
MASSTFYPALSTLIPVDRIPQEIGFLRSGLENLFNHLYFSDLQTSTTNSGDAGFYSLKVRTYRRLAIEIPGTNGLALVLNPDFDVNSPNPISSSLPVSLTYQWPILKFYKDFKPQSFSFSHRTFYDLLLSISGVNDSDLLYESIFILIDADDPIQEFIDGFNLSYSPLSPLIKSPDPNPNIVIDDLISQLGSNGNNFNPIDVIFDDFFVSSDFAVSQTKLEDVFSRWLSQFKIKNIKDLLFPFFRATFSLNFGLEFPLSVLRMVDVNGQPILIQTGPNIGQETPALLVCNGGHFSYDTKIGFDFDFEYALSFVNYAGIKGTGLYFRIQNAKIDLSKNKNIPEVTADGRPEDFTGVFVQEAEIFFPSFWNHDSSNSTAVIKGRNLIIGTGGLSGLISLESSQTNGAALFRLGDPNNNGNQFQLSLDQFLIEFKQNVIVQSQISGTMRIPGFKDANNNDAKIDVNVHIGNNGDFRITASEADGIHLLRIENVFDLTLRSLSIGRENDRWYVEASGSLQFTINLSFLESDFLKQAIDIKRIRIYQDGGIEFVGGGIALPTHATLKIGPVSLALSNIGFNSHQSLYRGIPRQYSVFSFNGALNTGPGGVDVRGDGVEYHFTRDGGDFHSYLRIAGIRVDIKIPGNASANDANILINGWLAMRHGSEGNYAPTGQPANYQAQDSGPDYQGSVSVTIRSLRISAKASMAMRPKVPAWIVDVELELPVPLALGATGLGIYGFRGLVGNHYVASKSFIGVNQDDSWYEYLKKKVPPRNKQGIGIEKFDPTKKGFSVGVGATIATMGDNGWTFSSKVFVLLSMPEMLLIEGQANVLAKRLGIESENDPPFYAYLIIDSSSVQAGIGVNYKIPQGGQILAVRGEMQLGFFFGNASAWYVNIGQELPENKRLQARLFTLFNAYAYLMVSSRGIKAGAGAKFDMQKRFGPVRVGLYAFIDTKGFISFRPIQIGGAIQLGGGVYLKVFGFGFEFRVAAGLSAEAPKPFIIAGFIEISIKVLFKRFRIRLSFTWTFEPNLNDEKVKLIDPADFTGGNGTGAQLPFKAVNMLTGESFNLNYLNANGTRPNPATVSNWNDYVIPMDSYLDIEFKRSVKPFTDRYGGGVSPLPQFTEYVAPQKARSQQVKHTFSVEKIELLAWNPVNNQWDTYNPWDALTRAFQNAGLQVNTTGYPFGHWQYNNVPGKYSSLRILSQTPFAVANGVAPEQFGILSQQLLCQGTTRSHTCQYWNEVSPSTIYPEGEQLRDRQLWLNFRGGDGRIGSIINPFGIDPSLTIRDRAIVEIYPSEPMSAIQLRLTSVLGCTVRLFTQVYTGEETIEGLPYYEHQLIQQDEYNWWDLVRTLSYEHPNQLISKIEIESYRCDPEKEQILFEDYFQFLLKEWNPDGGDLEPWQRDQIRNWIKQYRNSSDTSIVHLVALCRQWHELLKQEGLNENEQNRLSEWIDRFCGQTDFREVLPELCGEWSSVISDFERYPLLAQYAFTWHERYCLEASGYFPFDLCSVYVHEVCWLSEKDWSFNQLLYQNNQSVITAGINSLSQAINQALPPVWRPHTNYLMTIKTRDLLTVGSSTFRDYVDEFVVGFKTEGPLGFYHKNRPAYLQLENYQDPQTGQRTNKADQFKLANLRFYIDYGRSYPNADGKLIAAKPLYYKNPKLGLFFEKPYVYEFFTKWDEYAGNPAKEYRLISYIMDPLDKPGAPPVVPAAPMGWQVKMGQQAIPVNALDVEVISNILSQSNPSNPNTPNCTGITNVLRPPTMIAEVLRNYEIKPQKLYNAFFRAEEVGATPVNESVVHNYSFETSRYRDFSEHIQSYLRKVKHPDTGAEIEQPAFLSLRLEKQGSEWATINPLLQQILNGTLPSTDGLVATYASVYDRITTGVLKLEAQQAVTGLEFNVIKAVNTTTNATSILGILIKSPEPLNDPKLPAAQMSQTLQVTDLVNTGNTFVHVFSKDNASVFITNSALSLPLNMLSITFRFIVYNGITYETLDTESVSLPLQSI